LKPIKKQHTPHFAYKSIMQCN